MARNATDSECSFCGSAASKTAFLFKSASARICDACVGLAHAILQDKAAASGQRGTGAAVDITPYRIDRDLAALLTKRRMVKYRTVPLALYQNVIVLAVADPAVMPRVVKVVRALVARTRSYKGGKPEFNILLATPAAIARKIEEWIDLGGASKKT